VRIASLLPSATEILFAVGAGDEVVGVTHECDHPGGVAGLPRLTASAIDQQGQMCAAIDRHIRGALHQGSSIYRLDEALLSELEPDLIVTQELCDVCAVAYTQVTAAARGLPGEVLVLSLEPNTLEDICATVETVGAATGHVDEAERVAKDMRRRISEVAALPRPDPAPRVACVEWTDPLMVGGHWVPEMVRVAGGVDALGPEGSASIYMEWRAVIEAEPEVMVLMPCGMTLDGTLRVASDVTAHGGFSQLPCAASGMVAGVDGSSFYNRPGPRIVDGLEIMAAILRAKPGEPLPAGAAWVGSS
jgi:iron complex transport system substrate-binding protein